MDSIDDKQGLRREADKVASARFIRAGCVHPALDVLRGLFVERMIAEGPTRRMEGDEPRIDRAAVEPESKPLDPLALAKGDVRLRSFPQVVVRLQDVAADPTSSAQDMARIVSLDPGLTAFVLRVVNSASYGFSSRIETVGRAVAVLGMRQLADLALCRSLVDLYDERTLPGFDAATFWTHAVATGVVARALAARRGGEIPERFFIAGLLHDAGKAALWAARPELAARARDLARREALLSHEADRRVFGFDHARFGAIVLRSWNVPFALGNAVLRHHEPGGGSSLEDVGPVHVADVIATALGYGSSPDALVPPLEPSSWDSLGIRADDLPAIAWELDEKVAEAVGLFLRG